VGAAGLLLLAYIFLQSYYEGIAILGLYVASISGAFYATACLCVILYDFRVLNRVLRRRHNKMTLLVCCIIPLLPALLGLIIAIAFCVMSGTIATLVLVGHSELPLI